MTADEDARHAPDARAAEPASPVAPRDPSDAAPTLSFAAAQVVAWSGLAAVNAAFIAVLESRSPLGTRALHHVFDAGQLIAVGVALALLVAAWRRFAPRGRPWGHAVACFASLALAWLFLRPDLVPFAWRVAPDDARAELVLGAVTVGVALAPPLAAWLGRRCARPVVRWLGAALGLGLAAANNLALANDYRGVHLFAALVAAAWVASCTAGARLPAAFARAPTRRVVRIAALVGALGAVTSVVVPPRASVRAEMYRIDGAVVAPVLAAVSGLAQRGVAPTPAGAQAWFRDRRRLPDVPASTPRLLPHDAIVFLLSADSMGASLFTDARVRRRLPELDRLRREGVEFALARSPGTRTIYAWTQIFTGRYYSGIRWRGINPSNDPAVRFARRLTDAGISTVIVISCSEVGRDNPQLGEGHLRGGFAEQLVVLPRKGQQYATSTEAMPVLIERLRRHREGPLFLFAHFMDPHFPYDSAKRTGSRFQRFVAEVREVDRAIGRLRAVVDELGIADRTTFVVTADHGEAFGLHDTPYHTITLYEELLRVPLFVRVPGVRVRRVTRPVTLMDLGPTILDLFGLPTPASFLGQSLVPFLRGEEAVLDRPIAAEKPWTRAFVAGANKVIVDRQKGTEEIYDLGTDPGETRNLVDTLGASGEAQLDTLRAFFEAHAANRGR
jgi:arylsulfatase A-like enzyme